MRAGAVTPVFILLGAPGSGKTELLERLVREPGFTDTAIVATVPAASTSGLFAPHVTGSGTFAAPCGCMACQAAGGLVQALRERHFLRARGAIPDFRRVVVETAGWADPAPLLAMLASLPLVAARYASAGVITCVDAQSGADALERVPAARMQVTEANHLLITQAERATPATTAGLRRKLAALNPRAPLQLASPGALDFSRVFAPAPCNRPAAPHVESHPPSSGERMPQAQESPQP